MIIEIRKLKNFLLLAPVQTSIPYHSIETVDMISHILMLLSLVVYSQLHLIQHSWLSWSLSSYLNDSSFSAPQNSAPQNSVLGPLLYLPSLRWCSHGLNIINMLIISKLIGPTPNWTSPFGCLVVYIQFPKPDSWSTLSLSWMIWCCLYPSSFSGQKP